MYKSTLKSNKRFTISEVIDSLGVNKHTWLIFFLLGFSMVFDGYDYMIVSYTMAQIKAEWLLSSIQTGSLSSWSLIGLVIGSLISGIISDRIGRKQTLTFSIGMYAILTVPIYFVHSFEVFAILRILAGLGLGACIPVVTTFFSESTPTKYRGLFITFGMAWMIVGWVLAGIVATALVPKFGWRACYLVGGIPLLYSICLYFKMPESIYWLANKGRNEDAVKALKCVEKMATGKITEWDPNAIMLPPKVRVNGPKALFSKDFRKVTAGIWITYFCGTFIVYGINAWLPSLMLEKGFTLSSAYALAIANNAAAVIANCSCGFIAEVVGRRKNLIFSYFLAAIGICIVAFIGNIFTAILAANIFMGFAMNYAITAVQPLMAESYPTEFRNTGVSWCQACGRLGGVIAPIVAGLVIGLGIGYSISFLFYIAPAVIGASGAFFLVKNETKGKSLDQLANVSFN